MKTWWLITRKVIDLWLHYNLLFSKIFISLHFFIAVPAYRSISGNFEVSCINNIFKMVCGLLSGLAEQMVVLGYDWGTDCIYSCDI